MNKAVEFCRANVRKKTTPKYVKAQMREFLRISSGKDTKYKISDKKVKQIEDILKLLNMPKGSKAGLTLYECTVGYQWLFYIAILCTVYRSDESRRRYETGVLEICRKNFKALALDTPIPTPDGWKTMGEIQVGDLVFGRNGEPTMVIGESEIFNKSMYEVEFEDGEIIKASSDHIWTVQTKTSRNTVLRDARRIGKAKEYRAGGWYETTTEEMAADYFKPRKDGKGKEYKYRVPMNSAVEFGEKDLPVDPYLLGVWLGDGTSTNTNITVSKSDAPEMMRLIRDASGYSVDFYDYAHTPYIRVDKQPNNKTTEKNFRYWLRKYDLIHNKHIPEPYMRASREQRLALLQGLMDTDGTCSVAGECTFVQKSKVISEQTLELINSLGIKARMIKRRSVLNGKEISDIYTISFFAGKDLPVFRMARKYARQKEKLSDRMKAKSIVRITPIEAEPSKCIMVSSPEHLYLAGKHFTPTHNTFTIATIFILLFLTEPNFSKFYSVAPDGALSREVRDAISETLRSSPALYQYRDQKRFKILRDYILFKPTQTTYIPLNYSTSRLDGRLPNAFICDEAGALPNSYAIEAMRSGQVNIVNKLGFVISTKYPTIDNPFEDEIAYAKKVLDGLQDDETVFALLYEPDRTKNWETDDLILQQANPAALEIPDIWENLLKKRARAIAMESARENFVTKHCNIIYQGAGTETFIDVKDLRETKVANIDWRGRVVYLGLDLSQSNDNTSVSVVSVDEDLNILADSYCFIPEDMIESKTVSEKVDYYELTKSGKVIACGTKVIDYAAVEDFILKFEDRTGAKIQAVGYDRWNALSTAQKLERAGLACVEIRQHSSVLHPPTKLLKEKILSGEFRYTENPLLEINFQNARCVYDTNKNLFINKKKSRGKIDMVVALINAVYLAQQDAFLGQDDFTVQVI